MASRPVSNAPSFWPIVTAPDCTASQLTIHQQVNISDRSQPSSPMQMTTSISGRHAPPDFLTRPSPPQHQPYLSPNALAAGFSLAESVSADQHGLQWADGSTHFPGFSQLRLFVTDADASSTPVNALPEQSARFVDELE
eukprot:1223986-Rhodomonas_salina.1